MKLVSVVVVRDDADVLDAHLRFHLNAGVDLVLVGGDPDAAAILEPYVRTGHVLQVSTPATELPRIAVSEHGADWVLLTDADEFWWPRGESLKDVLAAIPPRYEIVQGLVRVFGPAPDDDRSFAERMTVRPTLLHAGAGEAEPLEWALRPLYRAGRPAGAQPVDDRRIPLRAWYPIEVFRFPFRGEEQTVRSLGTARAPRSTLEAEAAEAHRAGGLHEWYGQTAASAHGLADGSLVVDERLRDALRQLVDRESAEPASLELKPPGVVDDASYAIECAAVGEVDLAKLERQIRELEARITWLEERFWPRVLRGLRRIVKR